MNTYVLVTVNSFYKAKLFIKEHSYKYLWTKDGEILLKKDDGGKFSILTDLPILARLDGLSFGTAQGN